MSEKIIQLEYVSPRCVCGRKLPAGRKVRCFWCLPPRTHHGPKQPAKEGVSLEYTLADRVAQADAYGMSYGRFMAYLENGWKLPKQLRPVQWPLDSDHWGELC